MDIIRFFWTFVNNHSHTVTHNRNPFIEKESKVKLFIIQMIPVLIQLFKLSNRNKFMFCLYVQNTSYWYKKSYKQNMEKHLIRKRKKKYFKETYRNKKKIAFNSIIKYCHQMHGLNINIDNDFCFRFVSTQLLCVVFV